MNRYRMPAALLPSPNQRVRPSGQAISQRAILLSRLSALGITQIPDASVLPEDKVSDFLRIANDADLVARFQSIYCRPKADFGSEFARQYWISQNPWCPAPPPYVSTQTAQLRTILQALLTPAGYRNADLSSLSDAQLSQYIGMSSSSLQTLCSTGTAPWCPAPVIAPPPDQNQSQNQVGLPPLAGLCRYPANPRAGQPEVRDNYFESQAARDAWAAAHPDCPTPQFHPDVPVQNPAVSLVAPPVTAPASSSTIWYVVGAAAVAGLGYWYFSTSTKTQSSRQSRTTAQQ